MSLRWTASQKKTISQFENFRVPTPSGIWSPQREKPEKLAESVVNSFGTREHAEMWMLSADGERLSVMLERKE
jgi:hypothetical protein